MRRLARSRWLGRDGRRGVDRGRSGPRPWSRRPASTAGWTASSQAFYRQRPVDATAIGVHDYDSQLPDLSAAGLWTERLAVSETLHRAELSRLPLASLDETRLTDLRLARGALEIQRWELASEPFASSTIPPIYTGCGRVIGVLSLLRYPTRPLEERLEHLRERGWWLCRILFEAARANLTEAPAAWVDRAPWPTAVARSPCLTDGIPRYLEEQGLEGSSLASLTSTAAAAHKELSSFLERLPRSEPAAYACGRDALGMLYREAHSLEETPEEAEVLARARLAEARAKLDDALRACGATDINEAQALLATHHPPLDGYLDRHQRVLHEASGTQRASGARDLAAVPAAVRRHARLAGHCQPAPDDLSVPCTPSLRRGAGGRFPGRCLARG